MVALGVVHHRILAILNDVVCAAPEATAPAGGHGNDRQQSEHVVQRGLHRLHHPDAVELLAILARCLVRLGAVLAELSEGRQVFIFLPFDVEQFACLAVIPLARAGALLVGSHDDDLLFCLRRRSVAGHPRLVGNLLRF